MCPATWAREALKKKLREDKRPTLMEVQQFTTVFKKFIIKAECTAHERILVIRCNSLISVMI